MSVTKKRKKQSKNIRCKGFDINRGFTKMSESQLNLYLCTGYCKRASENDDIPDDIVGIIKLFFNFAKLIKIELKRNPLKNFRSGIQKKLSTSFTLNIDNLNINCNFSIYPNGKQHKGFAKGWVLLETKINSISRIKSSLSRSSAIRLTCKYLFGNHKAKGELYINWNTKSQIFTCTRLIKTTQLPGYKNLKIQNSIDIEWITDKEYEEKSKYKIGDMVQTRMGFIGQIKYIGPRPYLPNQQPSNKHYVVIDDNQNMSTMVNSCKFLNDESYDAKKYFESCTCFSTKLEQIVGVYRDYVE